MAEAIRITDVAPRDGLQNEPGTIATSAKVELVRLIERTGVDEVEVSSFVSPKWIPQLGDARDVFAALAGGKPNGICYSALVPNEKGLAAALEVNASAAGSNPLIDKVSVFTAASETFSQRNTNASVEETLARFEPVIRRAHEAGLDVRGYLSCVIACPFEGRIAADVVAHWARRLCELGVDELDLGDTIGAGTRDTIREMLERVQAELTDRQLAQPLTLHLHDTNGLAAECVAEALDCGVRSFDASAGGLGGCPYASTPTRRAPGNISTLVLAQAVRDAGFDTTIEWDAAVAASRFADSLRAPASDSPKRESRE